MGDGGPVAGATPAASATPGLSPTEERNRRMLRARDARARPYAQPLDLEALARIAHSSPAHFGRQFREVFGETPHRYLQRRRIERAVDPLRATYRTVTDIALDVGFITLGPFSRTFSTIVGQSPTAYRARFIDKNS